jgi:hypothetical protein
MPLFTNLPGTALSLPQFTVPDYHIAAPQPQPNPLLSPLAQGGSDTSEWWQQRKDVFTEQYGYVRLAPDFDPQVAWEFNESDFAPGKPITLAAFSSKLVSGARSEEREALFSKKLDEMLERQRAEYAQHQKIVKVTLTSAGVTLVLWKLLPLL